MADRPTKEVIRPTIADAAREFCRLLRGSPDRRKPVKLDWHGHVPSTADVDIWWLLKDMGFGPRLVEPVRTFKARDGEK